MSADGTEPVVVVAVRRTDDGFQAARSQSGAGPVATGGTPEEALENFAGLMRQEKERGGRPYQ